jgi:hypothetical protein
MFNASQMDPLTNNPTSFAVLSPESRQTFTSVASVHLYTGGIVFTGLQKCTLLYVDVALAASPTRVTDTAIRPHGVNTVSVSKAWLVQHQTLVNIYIILQNI